MCAVHHLLKLSFLLIFVFFSCSPEKKTREKLVEVPAHRWGVDFKICEMEGRTKRIQDNGRAVARVRFAENPLGGGTGFFISPDGHFLTNEHILKRSFCSVESCSGAQIVRHFVPGGDMELFNEFEVLAQSEELDFALIKVKKNNDDPIPYLEIDFESEEENFLEFNDNNYVLGHPHGAPLKISEVRTNGVSSSGVVYQSDMALKGNSGSPVISFETGKVASIITDFDTQYSRVTRDGYVPIRGKSISIFAVLDALEKIYPKIQSIEDLPKKAKIEGPWLEVRPALSVNIFKDEEQGLRILRSQRGKINSVKDYIEASFDSVKTSFRFDTEVENFLYYFKTLTLTAPSFFSAEDVNVDSISKKLEDRFAEDKLRRDSFVEGYEFEAIRYLQGKMSLEECQRNYGFVSVDGKPYLIEDLDIFLLACPQKNFEGRNILDQAFEFFEFCVGQETHPKCQGSWFLEINSLIFQYGLLSPMTEDEVTKSLLMLEYVVENAEKVRDFAKAQALHLILQRDPQMIGRASFEKTFQ